MGYFPQHGTTVQKSSSLRHLLCFNYSDQWAVYSINRQRLRGGVSCVWFVSLCLCKECKAGDGLRGVAPTLQGSPKTRQHVLKPDGKIRQDWCFVRELHFFFSSLQIIQERGSALPQSPSPSPSDRAWARPLKIHQTRTPWPHLSRRRCKLHFSFLHVPVTRQLHPRVGFTTR